MKTMIYDLLVESGQLTIDSQGQGVREEWLHVNILRSYLSLFGHSHICAFN